MAKIWSDENNDYQMLYFQKAMTITVRETKIGEMLSLANGCE